MPQHFAYLKNQISGFAMSLLPNKRKYNETEGITTVNTPSSSVNNPMSMFHEWAVEEGHVGIVLHTLSFLDVTVLVEKKQVCKKWKQLCTQTIDNKCPTPKNFATNKELRDAVRDYCKNKCETIEKIAITYGYPINKWQVGELDDFSKVFKHKQDFNEDISSWDLSNAKAMEGMFWFAGSFNQPLPWDTSNVTDMSGLFCWAKSFNQSLESWDTSKVISIAYMFFRAYAFNQSLEAWDTSIQPKLGILGHKQGH